MKLWGGRFEKGPSEVFERFSESFSFDWHLFDADVRVSAAWADELEAAGFLTAEECRRIQDAFAAMREHSKAEGYFEGADEDVHTFVIRKLGESVGDLAEKIHTGRSRNELVATDFRLWTKALVQAVRGKLLGLAEALLEFARREPEALLPGYTHLRRGQSILFAHYLLAYYEMFTRDHDSLDSVLDRVDRCPMGSGALAGSGFDVDRHRLAEQLGFGHVTRNSLDAVSDRDFALDALYAFSLVMLHASRLAEDWILYSSEEFGFLDLGDEVTSGSSLMPQKRNPDALELVRGKAGRVCGNLQALMMTLKGLPLGYNRDLQEDKRPLLDSYTEVAGCLDVLTICVETASARPDAMERAAEGSWVGATALAECLARKGVTFHRAHEIVGGIVLRSVQDGKRPADWTLEDLRRIAPEIDEGGLAALQPRTALENHAVFGGTAPGSVREALASAREDLKARREAFEDGRA